MDQTENLTIIKGLVGQSCERTLACNSIKFRFGCDNDPKGTAYLWIDPPWRLYKFEQLVTASLDYPHHNSPDYERKFKVWSANFNPLNHTVLRDVTFTQERDLELEFEGDYYIYVPYTPEEDEDNWYEHWYATIR